MPTTTCPRCRRYVEVQDLRDAALFDCPYCPPRAPALVLYKCTSCMKVSLLSAAANPATCPKCFTMIRPGARALFRPRVVPPLSHPADWVYHTTTLAVAQSIKRTGLRSIFAVTGKHIARKDGAFARNRDMRLNLPPNDPRNPVLQQLKPGVAYLRLVGLKQQDISALDQATPPIGFVPTGRDEDRPDLDLARNSALVEIARNAGILAPCPVPGFLKNAKDPDVNKQAVDLASQPHHCLTLWACEYVRLYYLTEEMKTTSRVYFLKAKCACTGYDSYTKGASKAVIVVLRVLRADIIGLEDDISEEKAECTIHPVEPRHIEIMVGLNPDRFRDDTYRHDDSNWINITQWST